jgi:hypothetical protein
MKFTVKELCSIRRVNRDAALGEQRLILFPADAVA